MSDSTIKPNKPTPLVEARGLTRFSMLAVASGFMQWTTCR